MKINHISAAPTVSTVAAGRTTQPNFKGKIIMPKLTNIKQQFIFIGPPACGKGTQTSRLAEHTGLPHIDTGSLLREEITSQSDIGKLIKSFIDKGKLVPEEIVTKIIRNVLSSPKCKNGYILDGFPRNLEQGKILDKMNSEINAGEKSIFTAIYFDINPKILLERIIHRQSCPKCGEIYNKKFKPSKIENECDTCHIPLKTRADDNEAVASSRFATYFEQTAPLVDFYERKGMLKKIDANGTIEEVWNRILNIIQNK